MEGILIRLPFIFSPKINHFWTKIGFLLPFYYKSIWIPIRNFNMSIFTVILTSPHTSINIFIGKNKSKYNKEYLHIDLMHSFKGYKIFFSDVLFNENCQWNQYQNFPFLRNQFLSYVFQSLELFFNKIN